MPVLADSVLDAALNRVATSAADLHICSQLPSVYADIATYSVGIKTNPTFTGPADRTGGGRKLTVDQISDGDVTIDGSASHWAITDGVGEILASKPLTSIQQVYAVNPFTIEAFDIGIPDAT